MYRNPNKKKDLADSLKKPEFELGKCFTLPTKCGEIFLEKDKFYFQCFYCESKIYEDDPVNFLEHYEQHLLLASTSAESIKNLDLIDIYKTEVKMEVPNEDEEKYKNEFKTESSNFERELDSNKNVTNNIKLNYLNVSPDDSIDNDKLKEKCKIIIENNVNIERLRQQFPATELLKNKFGRYKCPIENCEITLAYLGSVYRHLKNQHTSNVFKCLKCIKLFKSKYNLDRHLKIHEEKLNKERKKYYRESKLKLDLEQPNEDGLFHCQECNGKYKSAYIRYVHIRKKHEPGGSIPYYCEVCGKGLSSGNNLRQHMKTHTGERPYTCSYCDKSFANKFGCLMHMRIHTGDKRYKCNYCEKLFITSTERKVHERVVHTKEKPHQCEHCGKKFFTSQKLKEHFRRHTGERPYPCHICKKCFFNKSQLKDHMPSHTNEKPFECNVCGAKFPRKKALTTHMQLHSDVKQYVCRFCSQTFAQCAGLHSHMKQHEHNI